jgi:hypothetical protein
MDTYNSGFLCDLGGCVTVRLRVLYRPDVACVVAAFLALDVLPGFFPFSDLEVVVAWVA